MIFKKYWKKHDDFWKNTADLCLFFLLRKNNFCSHDVENRSDYTVLILIGGPLRVTGITLIISEKLSK